MGQTEIIIDLIQSQLLPYACLVFAQCRNAPSNSGDMLTQVEIEALDEGGVDVPTTRREHVLASPKNWNKYGTCAIFSPILRGSLHRGAGPRAGHERQRLRGA